MTKRTPTLEQKKIAKHARQALRAGRGIIFKGSMGIGKTLMCGDMIAKPITKNGKWLNLWFACQNAYAEKQAEEVGVACGD